MTRLGRVVDAGQLMSIISLGMMVESVWQAVAWWLIGWFVLDGILERLERSRTR